MGPSVRYPEGSVNLDKADRRKHNGYRGSDNLKLNINAVGQSSHFLRVKLYSFFHCCKTKNQMVEVAVGRVLKLHVKLTAQLLKREWKDILALAELCTWSNRLYSTKESGRSAWSSWGSGFSLICFANYTNLDCWMPSTQTLWRRHRNWIICKYKVQFRLLGEPAWCVI